MDSSSKKIASGGIEFFVAPDRPTIVLMGDSHGSMYGTTLKGLASEAGFNLNVISAAASDPLPDTKVYEDSINFLSEKKPDVTILVASWKNKLGKAPQRLETAIHAILQHSSYLIILTQPPTLPESASRQYFRDHGFGVIVEDADDSVQRRKINDYLCSLRSGRVKVINTEPYFINHRGEIAFVDANGQQLFHDRNHLSSVGADMLAHPISQQISELLEEEAREHGPTRPRKTGRLDL